MFWGVKIVYENMPEYFKQHNMTVEPASPSGWDDGTFKFESQAPSYKHTGGLSNGPEMKDAVEEPTKHRDDNGTNMGKGILALEEATKYAAIIGELFGPENRAKAEATYDKRTFYYSINLVNNFYKDRKIRPEFDSPMFKAQLINYVNDGSLPFDWSDIQKLKASSSKMDQLSGAAQEERNNLIRETGKIIFETRSTKTQRPIEPDAKQY
jgi:hypothetical protein